MGAAAIKAISLWQPWASLIAAGVKRHETRDWRAPYTGPVAIHAAKRLDVAGAPEALCRRLWGLHWPAELPLGAVVAVARLTGYHHAETVEPHLSRADAAAGNFARGRWAWALNDIRPLAEPIPLAGRQGLFTWTPPEDLAGRLEPALAHREACLRIGWWR